MKSWLLAAAMVVATGSFGWADGLYWVVGNRATNSCDIVTRNPVIVGDIWFADGPYKSRDDARLARSSIRVCPKDDSAAE
ncbi:hypothetical protein [Bradyrhizobium sp.]|uniref:hypothetical protein n=1 Tax=Bradyrhizobium sp. TaxID=376 RepID=UPI003C774DB4